MRDQTPDYASYSLSDLHDVRERVDRIKYPERYQMIVAEIEKRKSTGAEEIDEQSQWQVEHNTKVRSFGILFLLIGVCEIFYFLVGPALFTIGSRNWTPVACITFHAKKRFSSDKELLFKYTVNGTEYVGRHLSSTESSRRMSSWMKEYGDGEKAVCFVNPQQSEEAVLTWGWNGILLFFVVHSSFMIIGGIYFLRHPEKVRIKGEKHS